MQDPGEPHLACYQRARLTLVNENRPAIDCFAVRLSGSAMRIVMNEPVRVNVPVVIEIEDWVALGDTCYLEREYSHYAVGLQLDEFVGAVHAIEALRRNRFHEIPAAQILSLASNVAEQPVAKLHGSSGVRRDH